MSFKTYLPGAVKILTHACRYLLKYNVQIKANLPDNAAPAVDAAVEACSILIGIMDGVIPPSP